MKTLFRVTLLCGLLPSVASGTPSNLSQGVLIAHHPGSLQYSSGISYCSEYHAQYSISACNQQNSRIDLDGALGESSVWYAVLAWTSAKQWCGVQFGFGAYDEDIYYFLDSGACYPQSGLELPTPGWPGPLSGTTIVCTSDSTWAGNFLPVYYFCGYAYEEGSIPFSPHPTFGSGIVGTCGEPSIPSDIQQYGSMGLFSNGVDVCPSGGSLGSQLPPSSPDTPTSSVITAVASIRLLDRSSTEPLIQFSILDPAVITLRIVDPSGRVALVENLGWTDAGQHSIRWEASASSSTRSGVSSGIYFLQLLSNGKTVAEGRALLVR